MAYVNVPKDLTKVKTKVALGLTRRQLICFSIAAVLGIPTYFLTKGIVGGSVAVICMIGVMLPFFFLSMYERDGMSAEKVLRNILRHRLWAGARPYRTENLYRYLEKEGMKIANETKPTVRTTATSARKPARGKGKQG
jgi:hypothetical protein